ncbi:hypothetical protein [Streptoalloteichus hindustanus]|uniref:Uncharacterized protein n=1 Tax=Streptoalloteichus hindustanus TaxID=2017 RepID=A0A1M5DA42_STRHI|nr:hypothetical protein [Streptoalloteichus hindustanus]SHF63848.1 hypothetical protein SAMN05444320_104363 [Streptoalloteichus hindustanus]
MSITPETTGGDEPVFPVEALPPLPYAPHPGLLILAAPHCLLGSIPACQRLATWPEHTQVLLLRTRRALADAEHARHAPGVHAVTVIPSGPITVEARLAVTYSRHLHHVRRRPAHSYLLAGAPITGTTPTIQATARPPEMTLVPHLVTLTARGGARETVVWEWMWQPEAHLHLGPDLLDETLLRSMLPGLLWLRHASRHHQIPHTAAGRALARILAGRALSIQDVHRNFLLVHELLATHTHAAPDQGRAS